MPRDIPFLRTQTDDPPEKVKNARPDLTVLQDYQKREEEFLRRAADLSEVSALRDKKKEEHEQLKSTRLKKFLDGFNQISLKLKEMYQVSVCRCARTTLQRLKRQLDDHARWQCRVRTS